MRSARLSGAISGSMWSTAIGTLLLTLLVPTVALGSALVWSVRNARDGKGRAPAFVAALGVAVPSFLLGGAIAAKVSGFIRMFGALAHAAPEDRAPMAAQGLEESQSLLAELRARWRGVSLILIAKTGHLTAIMPLSWALALRVPMAARSLYVMSCARLLN